MEEIEPILQQLLEEKGDEAQEQALFLVNKVKDLNYIAIQEFKNMYQNPDKINAE